MASTDSDLVVLTIGHSNHSWEAFEALLRGAGVTAIADVRTSPWSKHTPQFSKTALSERLRQAGIAYVWLGDALGGRPGKPSLFRDGVANYERMAQESAFREGLDRVCSGAQSHRIALMCAEKHPLDCHRCLLVGRALAESGVQVGHILADGRIEPQAVTETQLLTAAGLDQDDIFESRAERLARAYRRRGQKVAFAEDNDSVTAEIAR